MDFILHSDGQSVIILITLSVVEDTQKEPCIQWELLWKAMWQYPSTLEGHIPKLSNSTFRHLSLGKSHACAQGDMGEDDKLNTAYNSKRTGATQLLSEEESINNLQLIHTV